MSLQEAPGKVIRIAIADDHPVVTEGLSHFLGSKDDFRVLWTASSGEEALERVRESAPDIFILDLKLPGVSGFELLSRLRRERPDVRIVILTAYAQEEYVRSAYGAGVRGYLKKTIGLSELCERLRRVHAGELIISEEDKKALEKKPEQRLSMRETQILEMIAEGLSNKMIADRIEIKEGTVKAHTNNIFKKLGVNSRTEAIRVALENGILQIEGIG